MSQDRDDDPSVTTDPGTETGPETGTDAPAPTELLLVSGMSGAGKGTAARVLEEFGWYVVDNLPVDLVDELLDRSAGRRDDIPRLALVTDVRSRRFVESIPALLERFGGSSGNRVLFLDATDDSLVQRFNNVRRRHPLQRGDGLIDGIERERELLAPVRGLAEVVVDTSGLSVHDLRRRLEVPFGDPDFDFHVTVESFGFKYGLPRDVDMLLDMRFLPNPHWDPELKDLTGLSEEVRRYVLADPAAGEFLDAALRMVRLALVGYRREGKRYMTIGVGCTGGKHRSVAVTETLAGMIAAPGSGSVEVHRLHRDLGRE